MLAPGFNCVALKFCGPDQSTVLLPGFTEAISDMPVWLQVSVPPNAVTRGVTVSAGTVTEARVEHPLVRVATAVYSLAV